MHNERKLFSWKSPLHLVKRSNLPWWQALLYRLLAVFVGLLLMCFVLWLMVKASPVAVFANLFSGSFGSERRIWFTFRKMALLLCAGLALIPAFRMRFWNLGGNGQILMGDLAAIMCMYFGGQAGWPNWAIILLMIPSSLFAGALWGVIPALFKAFFNTNESLFTLMMNYIASGIVTIFLGAVVTSGSGTLPIQEAGHLPVIGNNDYLLVLLLAVAILAFVYVYLRFSKHGYELEVVGDSENTAKYIGINVRWTIIRTMALSGALCGVIGMLLAGAMDFTITADSAQNMGFTAIMVAWLAKFDPFAMLGTSFLVAFLDNGMASGVQRAFGITNNSIGQIVIGIVYFCIIAVEFFINYRIQFQHLVPDVEALTEKGKK